jgi:hypothetical protein
VFGLGGAGEDGRPSDAAPSFHEATRRFQAELIARTLRRFDWNVTAAARHLDIRGLISTR